MPKALSFNGSNSYVDFGEVSKSILDLGTNFNIKVKTVFNSQTGWGTILGKEEWTPNLGWLLYRSSNITLKFKYGGSELWYDHTFTSAPFILEIDADGTNLRLIIDGVLKKTQPLSAFSPATTTTARMGARHDNVATGTFVQDYFNGHIYSTVIVKDGVIVADWQFEEGTGTTTADSSATGANGVITNPVWIDEVLQSTTYTANGIITGTSTTISGSAKIMKAIGSILGQTTLEANVTQANKAAVVGSASATSNVVAKVITINNVVNVIRGYSSVNGYVSFSGDLGSNTSIVIKIPYGSNIFNVPFGGKTAVWGEVIPIQEDVESSLKCSFLDANGIAIFTETRVLGTSEPLYDFLMEYERPSNSTVLKVELINLTATEVNYATLDNASIPPIATGSGVTGVIQIRSSVIGYVSLNGGSIPTPTIGIGGSYFIDGSWRAITVGHVKVGGTWKTIVASYIKIGGVWKPIGRADLVDPVDPVPPELNPNTSIVIKIPYGSNIFNVPFGGKTAVWGEVIPIQEDVESSLKCSFLDANGIAIFTETRVLGTSEPLYDFLMEYERPFNSTVLKVELINLTATEVNFATLV